MKNLINEITAICAQYNLGHHFSEDGATLYVSAHQFQLQDIFALIRARGYKLTSSSFYGNRDWGTTYRAAAEGYAISLYTL